MLRAVVQSALHHRIIIVVIALVALAAGFDATRKLSVDAFPDVTNIQVQVATEVPGRSPDEVERIGLHGLRSGDEAADDLDDPVAEVEKHYGPERAPVSRRCVRRPIRLARADAVYPVAERGHGAFDEGRRGGVVELQVHDLSGDRDFHVSHAGHLSGGARDLGRAMRAIHSDHAIPDQCACSA